MAKITGPNGQVASVTSSGQLTTFATSQDLSQALNIEGHIYSVSFTANPAGAGDYFFYLKNTGTLDIAVNNISVSSTVPTKVTYEVVSGTPIFVSATDAAVINLNLGSTNELSADAQFDTDITGLTSAGEFLFEECAVADTRYLNSTPSSVIIPLGKAIAFKRVEATGIIDMVVGVGTISL